MVISSDQFMKQRELTVGAAEFKAKCLELIDEVHGHKRNSVVITKRGRPYAKLVPVESADTMPFIGCMQGTVKILGDLTLPLDVEWNALKD
jgi:prevent-host-death family protein